MATVAPTAARSCLALTLLPAALGRLLVPIVVPLVPALLRLLAPWGMAAVLPDTLRGAPETGLWGLTPDRIDAVVLRLDPGGSGRGRGTDMVLCRFIGDDSRVGIRGIGTGIF
jgi:hypothetical protein